MQSFRRVAGGTLGGVFGVLYCLLGIVSLVVNLMVLNDALGWGFCGIILAVVFFPVTILVAPFYALIAWGNPVPLVLTFGGFAILLVGGWIASKVEGET